MSEQSAERRDEDRERPIAPRGPGGAVWNIIGFVLAAAGWWISLDLTILSYGGGATNPVLAAQCGGEKTGDCLSVLRSERAYLGVGESPADPRQPAFRIPWAVMGAGYFAFVALWYLFVGRPSPNRTIWHFFIVAVVVIGAYNSANFLYSMAYELKRWCVWCVAAHAVNGVLVIVTLIAFPWRRPTAADAPHPTARHGLAALTAGLIVSVAHPAAALFAMSNESVGRLSAAYGGIVKDPDYVRWRYERQPLVEIPLRPDELSGSGQEPANTVVAFVDFQCPGCRAAHDQITRVSRMYAGQVRVVFRHFPQDAKCNPFYEEQGHPAACRAAVAAEAARLVGGADGFRRLKATMYDRQHDLELDRFADWAREVGLDPDAFRAAMRSPAVLDRIREDAELGHKLGVHGVPVVFLNGRRVEGWQLNETWEALLRLNQGAASRPAASRD